jgi:hypothetical protein
MGPAREDDPHSRTAFPRAGKPNAENIAILELVQIGRVGAWIKNGQIRFGSVQIRVESLHAVGKFGNCGIEKRLLSCRALCAPAPIRCQHQ